MVQRQFFRRYVFCAILKPFLASESGNVAILFTLSLIPILLAVSLSIDFVRASDAKVKLDAAIDSVALYAVTKAASNSAAVNFSAEIKAAKAYFTAALGPAADGINIHSIDITLAKDVKDSTLITSAATYSADIKTIFGNLFKPTIEISGSAASEISIPSYIDFYLLLDNSPSMGIAASDAEIARLRGLTFNGPGGEQPDCQFACHEQTTNPSTGQIVSRDGIKNTWEPDNSSPTGFRQDYFTIAKNASPPIQLRIDLLAKAVQSLTSTAKSTQQRSGLVDQFRMAIYTFNEKPQNIPVPGGTASDPLSADLTAVGTIAAANVSLGPFKDGDSFARTDYSLALAEFDKLNLNPGDGSTQAKAQKFVFFVTDGVTDAAVGGSRSLAPIDATLCSRLKQRGIQIAVLYTPYIPLPNNSFFNAVVAPFIDQVPVQLAACATPGLFYVADSAGIAAALNKMFQDAVRSARLTQ